MTRDPKIIPTETREQALKALKAGVKLLFSRPLVCGIVRVQMVDIELQNFMILLKIMIVITEQTLERSTKYG